jgi:hypothetical protein
MSLPFTLIVLEMVPLKEARTNFCQYANPYHGIVPGDSGNPFVALWQGDLLAVAVLLIAGVVIIAIGRAHSQPNLAARYLGYILLIGAAMGVILTGVTLASSQPLACAGAPGTGQLSPAQQQAAQLFQTLSDLSALMLYITVLLVVVTIIAGLVILVRSAWRIRTR